MNVVRSVLPKGMSRRSSSSQSRSASRDYVLVSPPPSSSPASIPNGVQSAVSANASQGNVGEQPVVSGAELVQSGVRKGDDDRRGKDEKDDTKVSSRRTQLVISTAKRSSDTDNSGHASAGSDKPRFATPAGALDDIRRMLSSKDPADILRLELLKANGAFDANPFLSAVVAGTGLIRKHNQDYTGVVTLIGTGANTGAVATFAWALGATNWMNQILLGTSYYNRIGQFIKLHRIIVRGRTWFQNLYTSAVGETWTTNPRPAVQIALVRDVVPNSSTVPRVYLAADAAAVGTNVSAKSNIGRALAIGGCIWMNAVENPMGKGIVEVLREINLPDCHQRSDHSRPSIYYNMGVNPNTTETPPECYQWEMDVDLHGMKTMYLSANSYPVTNGISLQAIAFDPTQPGGTASTMISCFTDVSFDMIYEDYSG